MTASCWASALTPSDNQGIHFRRKCSHDCHCQEAGPAPQAKIAPAAALLAGWSQADKTTSGETEYSATVGWRTPTRRKLIGSVRRIGDFFLTAANPPAAPCSGTPWSTDAACATSPASVSPP